MVNVPPPPPPPPLTLKHLRVNQFSTSLPMFTYELTIATAKVKPMYFLITTVMGN